MVVDAPEELIEEQMQHEDRTSTEQPTVQVAEQVRVLLLALSNDQLSLKGLMEKVGLKPVSYTHLDVYKRQIFIMSIFKDWIKEKWLTA